MGREVNRGLLVARNTMMKYMGLMSVLQELPNSYSVMPKTVIKTSEVLNEFISNFRNSNDLREVCEIIESNFVAKIQATATRRKQRVYTTEYLELLLNLAESLEKSGGSKQKIEEYLTTIVKSSGKEDDERYGAVKLKAEYALAMRKLRKKLQNNESIDAIKTQIAEIIKRDKNHILDTERIDSLGDYDMLKSFFSSVNIQGKSMKDILAEKNVELLAYTIFPKGVLENPNSFEGTMGEGHEKGGAYSESLSAIKRLKYIIENFNVSNVLIGKENSDQQDSGSFYGSILFEMEDSDVVIVEDFFEGKPGKEKESYAKATYILAKSEAMKMIKSEVGRLQVKNENKENEAFRTVYHSGGDSYYRRLSDRYKEVCKALQVRENTEQGKEQLDNQPIPVSAVHGTPSQKIETEMAPADESDSDKSGDEDSSIKPATEYSRKEEKVADLIANLIKVNSLSLSIDEFQRVSELVKKRMQEEQEKSEKTAIVDTIVGYDNGDSNPANSTSNADYDDDSENR